MQKMQIILFLLTAPLFATLDNQVNQDGSIPRGWWILISILLWAYFTKKQKTDDDLEETSTTGNDNQPEKEKKEKAPERMQHYEFAHRTLRDMFFKDTNGFIKYLLTPEGSLRRLWIELGIDLTEKYDGVEKIESLFISREAKEFDNILFVVIQLPKPIQSPEAYFIGLIIPRDTAINARYITLEYGMDEDDTPMTFLCEWSDNSHLNLGEGGQPLLKEFKDTLFTLANVSAREWEEAIPSYQGEPWMVKLWKWADTHKVSTFEIPRYSQDLIMLENLDLSSLDLTNENFPEEINNLVHLETLNLSNNKLQTFPQGICQLSNLTQLSLENNQIQVLPSCIGNLNNLVALNVANNKVIDVSERISEMRYLENLNIEGNPMKTLSQTISHTLMFNQEKRAFHRVVKTDWRTLPLPAEYKTFALDRKFTHEEMGYITMGEEVHSQNDRWFIYWKNNCLYFHRSQSGYCIAVVYFKKDNNLYGIDKVDINNQPKQFVADENMRYITEYFDGVLKWKSSTEFTDAQIEVLSAWEFHDD